MTRRRRLSIEELEWLRASDPGEGAPLADDERRAIRGRMLSSLYGAAAPAAGRWVWAMSAVAACFVVTVLMWPRREALREPSAAEQRIQESTHTDSPAHQLAADATATGHEAQPEQEAAFSPSADASEPMPQGTVRAAPTSAASGDASGAGARSVEMHLVAPGGTRIVWLLDPNLKLHASITERTGATG